MKYYLVVCPRCNQWLALTGFRTLATESRVIRCWHCKHCWQGRPKKLTLGKADHYMRSSPYR